VINQLKRLCDLIEGLEHIPGDKVNRHQYENTKDELRIFLLEDGPNRRSAFMAMEPLNPEIERGEHGMHSVLIMDDSQLGYAEISEFFKSLLDGRKAIEARPFFKEPRHFLEEYFQLDPGELSGKA